MDMKKCPKCKKVVKTYAYIHGFYFCMHLTDNGKYCPNSNSDTKTLQLIY